MYMSSKDKHFPDQLEDEELLFVFRKHPIVMRKGLLIGLIALLLGTVPSLIKPEYSYLFGGLLIGMVIGLLFFIPSYISWYFSIYIVTDQRLLQITQKGLWTRSVVDIGLNQVQMVNYEVAGFNQTVLGFGTIMMQTFVGDLVIHEVHHPEKIQQKILKVLRDKGIVTNPPPQSREADDDEGKNEEA